MALTFPAFDPVALQLGPLAIRWYSLAYVGGIMFGWWLAGWHNRRRAVPGLTKDALDDLVLWTAAGIILGGRLGFVLFYKPGYYWENPGQILHIWEGGMSFHGGLIGFITAYFIFCWRRGIPFLALMDVVACVVPIGLFLGRIANFINGELYGRVTDVPWGMVFPHGGAEARHPSQLYEAGLEGLMLLIVLNVLAIKTRAREKVGLLSGLFLLGYSASRGFVELFREPDAYLGFFFGSFTMGQLLSAPMVVIGLYLVLRRKPALGNGA